MKPGNLVIFQSHIAMILRVYINKSYTDLDLYVLDCGTLITRAWAESIIPYDEI